MNIDLIIFDKDGTLIDVHYYWCGMIELRAEKLSKDYVGVFNQQAVRQELMSNMGIDLHTRKIKTEGPVGVKPREFIIKICYQTLKKYCESITVDQISSTFQAIDECSKQDLAALVKPLRGVEDLLLFLEKKNIKIAIATVDLTSRAKLAMDSIGLVNYFDYIVGSDLVKKSKPSPDLVNYICDKMLVDKNRVIVVGDSIVDLEMAESAGVGFIGVKTGLHSPEFLSGSKILVDDLTYIEELLCPVF